MKLLQEVEKAGSDVELYVGTLDQILLNKIQSIQKLRNDLSIFKDHLQQEELLSNLIAGASKENADKTSSTQREIGMRIEEEGVAYNLAENSKLSCEAQLLESLSNF